MKIILFILTVLFAVTIGYAQTVRDFKSRYGEPVNIFLVRSDVSAGITTSQDGRISELRLERYNSAEKTINLDTSFPPKLIKELLDEFVPVETRGKKDDSPALITMMGGASVSSEFYENVCITYYGSADEITTIVIKWNPKPISN